MKVIHFAPYYPPERLGGVGEFAARLHEALVAAGHESLVVTRGEGSDPRVRRIARSRLGWFAKSALLAGEAARCDVAHFQAGEALPALLLLRLRRRHPRILTTFHVGYRGVAASLRPYTLEGRRFGGDARTWLERALVATAHRAVDAIAARASDAVATVSRTCAREILGDDAGRARVVYHGLPPLPEPPPAPAERVALLYAGAAGHRKRVAALPFVLERVRREVPGARLRIAGFDLAREPWLRALFAERDLTGAVESVGRVASSDLACYYASADALVVPSAYEGLPLVIVEAMQCGLPAVATRTGANEEAIEDGVNGFLVEPDRPDALAERCVRLLRDPGLRRSMAFAARRTARERFGMERHVSEYLALYSGLCDPPA